MGVPGDEGATHTLEAIIAATLMVSSIAFVATYQVPPPPAGGRDVLQQRVSDTVKILVDTPIHGSSMGPNLLSVATAECLQGNCSRLQGKLDRLIPEGARYAAYLSNGHGRWPLIEQGSPAGEAVSARVSFEPAWSSTILTPAVPLVNPVGDPVVLYALPIYNSNALTSDGTPFIVTLKGVRVSDGAQYLVQGAGTTRASGVSEVGPHAAVSAYFVDALGQPVVSMDARGTTLTPSKSPSGAALPLRLRVAETGGGIVPSGARVTVMMPPGWTANASSALNAATWDVVANATDPNGSTLVAKLKAPLSSGVADLGLDATYAGDAHDGYAIRAVLSGGAGATATLLVRGDAKDATATFEVPTILASAPRPLGVGATTTWTLATQLPAVLPGVPAEAVLVNEITVRADSGEPIFASVTGVQGGGAWTLDGAAAKWTGAVVVTHDAPLALAFNATGRAVARPPSDRAGYVPEVLLEGKRASLPDETSPGLRRVSLAPGARAGYNASAGLLLVDHHGVESDAPYRATELPGSTEYSVGYATPLQEALFGSAVQASERQTPVGGTARFHVNVQPAMYLLAEHGFTPSVKLHVYGPWAGDGRAPLKSLTLALPVVGANGTYLDAIDGDDDGTPDDASAGVYDVELPIPPEWPFGPYLVEGEVSWTESVTKVLGGVPVSETFDRRARVYDYFVVSPPGALTPPVPIYELHLVAWFEDWR